MRPRIHRLLQPLRGARPPHLGTPRIVDARPDTRLLLVGGGVAEDGLRRAVERLGLRDRVVFTGRVPHERVRDYYALCDAMVYPRRDIRLTRLVTPMERLESMAQGRLVVASDIGGHCELIRDGETGLLFEAGSSQALAPRVLALLDEPDRWPGLRQAGRRFVETERTWEKSVLRTQRLYESIARAR